MRVGMAEDVYLRLRKFMDGMPGGFPATDNGVELKILRKFFTPQEAEMALNLKPLPEPVAVIAGRAGMEETEAAGLLESMASRGNVFRIRAGEQSLFMAMSFLPGLFEFHIDVMDRELAELFHEYAPHLGRFWSEEKIRQKRIVPVDAAVGAQKEVATYDRVREMVAGYADIAVSECICRVKQGLLGKPCERPHENCLIFGPFAVSYYVENGIGRRISLEECLEIIDQAEEAALVLYPSNSRDIINICCCCSCCCNELRILKMHERPADEVLSSYRAVIDADLCTACGTCMERCQMEAILEGEDNVEVVEARCIGCGLCVPTCPSGAASMVPKGSAEGPPANILELNEKILRERGLV
jgi:H+/Na+-translocating ferredoxin:NAD+ oxidoreductase subunit B